MSCRNDLQAPGSILLQRSPIFPYRSASVDRKVASPVSIDDDDDQQRQRGGRTNLPPVLESGRPKMLQHTLPQTTPFSPARSRARGRGRVSRYRAPKGRGGDANKKNWAQKKKRKKSFGARASPSNHLLLGATTAGGGGGGTTRLGVDARYPGPKPPFRHRTHPESPSQTNFILGPVRKRVGASDIFCVFCFFPIFTPPPQKGKS